MVDYTNDRSRHEQTTGTPPELSSGDFSGDGVLMIPLGLVFMFGLLVALFTVFQ